ncbi:hypothetical protein [Streptomyces sp. NPDC046197]|uniref:hypothetical protein n=1 Tax=Streptomyces sp. NPDC046197 TaxID=3154337 RepID=UPI0033FE3D29
MTSAQEDVYARAIELASDQRLFTTAPETLPELHRRLTDLHRNALQAFGQASACRLLLALGTTKPHQTPR